MRFLVIDALKRLLNIQPEDRHIIRPNLWNRDETVGWRVERLPSSWTFDDRCTLMTLWYNFCLRRGRQANVWMLENNGREKQKEVWAKFKRHGVFFVIFFFFNFAMVDFKHTRQDALALKPLTIPACPACPASLCSSLLRSVLSCFALPYPALSCSVHPLSSAISVVQNWNKFHWMSMDKGEVAKHRRQLFAQCEQIWTQR